MDRVQGVNSPGMLRPSLEIKGAPQSHRPVLERHCAPGLHDVGRQHAHRAVSARTPRFGCVPIRHRTGVLHHSLHRVASARTHGKEGADHAFRRRLGCARAQDRAHAHRVRPCCGDHARRAPVGDDAVHWIHPGRAGNGSWTTLPACVPIWWRPGLSAPSARRLSRPHVPGKTPHTSSRKEMRQHEHYHGN